MNTTYWADDNGRITCVNHAGNYLSSAIQTKPKSRVHLTPMALYVRLTKTEVADFTAEFGYCCETCPRETK
jgi:hypothetical protein